MARFALYNAHYGETVHTIEMDEALLDPKAGILHVESMTLRPLKSGANYTLIPMEDHTVQVLRRIRECYERVTKTGCPLYSTWINRMDEMLQVVGLMFDKVEYALVENAEDMQNLLSPPDDEWQPKKVYHNVLGDLFDQVIAK